MTNYTDFLQDLEHGFLDESQLSDFIYLHICTDADRRFMADNKITVAMILCGRIIEGGPETFPDMQGLQNMIDSWNKTVGEVFIFTSYV